MKLSDIVCRNSKPKEKPYKLFDGKGLYLLIKPNGAKHWRFKYRFLSTEKLLAIGPYPFVSLAQAREERDKAKKLLAQNPPKDPVEDRKENKRLAIRNAGNTFKTVALEWHEINSEHWSDNYAKKVLNGLELNIFPILGHRPIAKISPPELLESLRKIEKRGALDISRRTRGICSQIFRYGIQTSKCDRDTAADLKGALKTRKIQHFRTIDVKELPDFLKALERNEARIFGRTRRAVWLSLYTFCRPVEIRKNRWVDNNLKEKCWIIPGELMKMNRDHIVPLSKQALVILEEQKEELEHMHTEWVFPSQVNLKNPMSNGTVNKAIKGLGFGEQMVAHGIRALARTTIREELGYESEIIEKQLAHKTKNPLGEAYDRTQFLKERTKMMQEWADYLDAMRKKGA